jgi:hypothetical protein
MANRTRETNPMIESAGIWDAQNFHGLPDGVSVLTDEFKERLFDALGLHKNLSEREREEFIVAIDKALNRYSNLKARLEDRPSPAAARNALRKGKKAIASLNSALEDVDPECARLLQQNLDDILRRVQCEDIINFKMAMRLFRIAIHKTHKKWPGPKKGTPETVAVVNLIQDLGDVWEKYTNRRFNFSPNQASDGGTVNAKEFITLFSEVPELKLTQESLRTRFREVVSKRIKSTHQ